MSDPTNSSTVKEAREFFDVEDAVDFLRSIPKPDTIIIITVPPTGG